MMKVLPLLLAVSSLLLSFGTHPTVGQASNVLGFLDTATPTGVAGWTCDPDNYNQYLQVNIFIDGQYVATTTANQQREQAVGNQCGGNSNHGFTYTFSQDIQQRYFYSGQTHSVSAYAIGYPYGETTALNGSPMSVTGNPVDNYPAKGYLDSATATNVAGWACDQDDYSSPLQINIFIDGQYVATTTANQQREQAVGNQCGGNTYHGFSYTFSQDIQQRYFYSGQTHSVSAYAIGYPSGDSTELTGSPKNVQGPQSATPKGYLDTATQYNVAGWTCDGDDYNRYLQVNIFIDGQYVATTTANQQREQAVGDQCGGNRYHGFSYNFPDNIQRSYFSGGQTHSISAYAINYPSGQPYPLTGSPKSVYGSY